MKTVELAVLLRVRDDADEGALRDAVADRVEQMRDASEAITGFYVMTVTSSGRAKAAAPPFPRRA